ncbi:solute:sodium symporter family transporter [Kordiimonas sp. SCSIO 12610]|uniref:solute:sodium symporter family transporter n=1 Tax=Kordiimonas sp. SCSIO 12610 TaxID=2829597 RepID=UPI00210A75CE|nr:solute:sodium symporter family transporter [Kordiimonas sp. SCSIO 12610]UTW54754.1 solute:sodium symporter family transporter [Kordiimonas sp. SCSIO 12610]
MTGAELILTLVTCVVLMALVAWVSYVYTRGSTQSKDGYFLAGRNLSGLFIAGSLLLTNLSAEQLIGLNGSAYGFNLSSMAWEVTAAVSTIAMAIIFLPKYLAGAFTTLPEFLRNRFDPQVQQMSLILFMLGYGLVTIPSVLYSGSIAVIKLFDVPELLGVGQFEALIITVLAIGCVGSVYAIFGGLKAVAVSDTLNGIGLLIVGILVPLLGLYALGGGSILDGIATITSEHPEKLNAIGGKGDPTPFGTIFTGMIMANLFYWCTNQYVIQRTLAAQNLAEGQKGVLFSGFLKLLVPFFMMLPGVIAFHLYGAGLTSIDLAYPQLIRDLFPIWLMGFFLAVLLGAVFSSFNSLLNSAATLFCLDIYTPLKGGKVSEHETVRMAKIVSVIMAIFSFIVAPLLYFAPEGLWQIIRIFTGFYNIPIVVIVLVGLFSKRIPAIGAKMVIIFHVIAYGLLKFALDDYVTLHFLHLYALLFTVEVGIMLLAGYLRPRPDPWVFKKVDIVDLTPWRYTVPVAFTLFSAVVLIYVLFSPIGLAGNNLGLLFYLINGGVLLLNVSVWWRAISTHQNA